MLHRHTVDGPFRGRGLPCGPGQGLPRGPGRQPRARRGPRERNRRRVGRRRRRRRSHRPRARLSRRSPRAQGLERAPVPLRGQGVGGQERAHAAGGVPRAARARAAGPAGPRGQPPARGAARRDRSRFPAHGRARAAAAARAALRPGHVPGGAHPLRAGGDRARGGRRGRGTEHRLGPRWRGGHDRPRGAHRGAGDAADLLAAMERMSNPTTARRMGEAGRARARLFTWDLVAHRMLQAAGLEPRNDAAWDGLFPG